MKKSFNLILLVFFFTVLPLSAECCICNQKSFEESYTKSDVIFLGSIINSDEDTFSMKVYEYFKGNVSDTIYGILDGSCTVIPNKNENWLIYGNMLDGKLLVPMCYSSRSFSNPMNPDGYFISPPTKGMSNSEFFIYENNAMGIELSELQYEIYTLRYRRLISEIQTEKHLPFSKQNKSLIFVLIALVLISISLNIFVIVKQKPPS